MQSVVWWSWEVVAISVVQVVFLAFFAVLILLVFSLPFAFIYTQEKKRERENAEYAKMLFARHFILGKDE